MGDDRPATLETTVFLTPVLVCLIHQIRLCESGLYEFGLAGAGATAWLEHSRASEQLRATVTGDGESAAALFEAGAAGRGFVYPEGRCLRANMEFEDSSDPEDTTWQLQMPVRFPPLMSAAASWRLPPLTEGSKSTPLDRYLCQRGAYTVTVSAQRDGDSYGNFALAFNGNASALPSCSQSYCVYHGCSSSSGGGFFASLQDNADQAWEGLGNEEGSLAIDITGGDSGDQPVNCGYSSNLNGKEPPEGGKPAQDVVHFLKREGSAEGVLVPGEPQHWELSYEVRASLHDRSRTGSWFLIGANWAGGGAARETHGVGMQRVMVSRRARCFSG